MAQFHPLRVADIKRDTRDSVILTLEPSEDAENAFKFIQGQYLTFRREFDGEEMRRSYSICAGVNDDAGVAEDAGVDDDAGVTPSPGVTPEPGAPDVDPPSDGCSCDASTERSPVAGLWLLAFAVLGVVRRRRLP